MIYVDNTTEYSQRLYIPRDEPVGSTAVTGHTFALQSKDYVITQNGTTRIHPDGGYDGISSGTISVYVGSATGITFEHLDVTEDGLYVPTGDSVYTGVTVQVYDGAYQDGYDAGRSVGYDEGIEAQKGLLTSTTFTENGTYTRENGWNEVNVALPLTTVEGGIIENGEYEYSVSGTPYAGLTSVKVNVNVPNPAKLMNGYEVTHNGVYTPSMIPGYDGWSTFSVAVPQSGATLTSTTITYNGRFTPVGADGFSAVTVNVPITGETYPRSYITVDIYSDDYDGLSGLTIQFKADEVAYSSFTPTSAVTSTTVTYNPGIGSRVEFMTPDGYQCTGGKFVDWYEITRWGNHTYLYYGLTRYSGSVTEVRLYTLNGSATTFDNHDMVGVTYDGSTTAYTAPTRTFNVSEQRWDLEYDGAIVNGFAPLSPELKSDVRRIELPYEFSRIYGLGSTPNLETIYAEGLTHIGPADSSYSSGLGDCTALTAITSVIGLRKIEDFACQRCTNLSEIDLSRVTSVGNSAFMSCPLRSVDLSAVEQIHYQAFYNCTDLTAVTIGRNCTYIGTLGFGNCTSLSTIWCLAETAPSITSSFYYLPQNGTLYVPNGSDYSTWMASLPSGWTVQYI